MSKYAGMLPTGFHWILDDEALASESSATLFHRSLAIAHVRRVGRGWMAIANQTYFPVVPSVMVVSTRGNGQACLARWLRLRKTAVLRACEAAITQTHESRTQAVGN